MRYLLIVLVLFLTGCGKKVYEPEHTVRKEIPENTQDKTLVEYTKKTLTFTKNKFKLFGSKKTYFDKEGHNLGQFIKINDDLAVKGNELYVISQKTEYKLPFLIFSATKKNRLVAVVFENGKFGIYDLNDKKMKYVFDGDEVLSVKYLHAQPLFYKDLVLFPLLSGSVAVVDLNNGKYIRNLNISQNQFNDNVIFLKIVNNQLFMATPSKLILFNPSYLIDYKADIKHVIDYNGYIYIFTVDGYIIKLNTDLKELKKVKLPYASFYAPGICKGNIWTVEKEEYLIKITPDLNVTVYTGNGFDTDWDDELKIDGCKIYNNDKVYMIE